ncbi:hypothetical protein TcWFU_007905 [Taenia crassiceps]|uniref:Uncharacterized protein n=1 Tax=Taenia crassiceps TaxID=6207 RepID=A0ABR4Q8H5_9CEST
MSLVLLALRLRLTKVELGKLIARVEVENNETVILLEAHKVATKNILSTIPSCILSRLSRIRLSICANKPIDRLKRVRRHVTKQVRSSFTKRGYNANFANAIALTTILPPSLLMLLVTM